jgi:hypothetical protein
METAYGAGDPVLDRDDLLTYLWWCRNWPSPRRAHR